MHLRKSFPNGADMALPPRIFLVLIRRCHRFVALPARQRSGPPRHHLKPPNRWWQNALPIVIIQDIDPQPGVGAFWGEVQTNIHKGLGVLGAVTNGSFRDVPDSARGFNLIGGKVGPSHAFVHLVDIDCQVTVYGLTAKTNDIIHADQHGAVLIPPTAVKQIPAVVDLITRREAIILEAAKSADFTIATLKAAMGQMKDIH